MESSPVEQVRAGVDVVDLVSQHVQLKKAGRTFKGLCPFHSEKTPSFVVFPDTQRWHCFGCGEGGDIFTFLMKIENLTFGEALRQLADRIGVVVTQTREPEERKEAHKRLYAANEAAAVYYHDLLLKTPAVRAYVAERGITDDTIREFLLGYAPNAYEALQRHLGGQGYTNDELLEAGLLTDPENGPPRDFYRGRLMFPIRDTDDRVVGFGGRVLSSDAQPKYLNGRGTPIFDKGSTLFGLNYGAQAIRKEHRVVIVEGYVDVVVAHQAGFRNVVATLGTAITDRHLRQLVRYASEICLALDPDTAGETAALRGAEVARTALVDSAVPVPTWRGLVRYEATSRATVTVAALPDGKDPDELILQDPERWRTAIAAARPVIDYALDWVAGRHDLSTARGKSEAAEALVPLLLDIADPIQRSHYVELAATKLHVEAVALTERLRTQDSAARRRREGPRPAPAPSAPSVMASSLAPQTRSRSEQHYAIALFAAAVERGITPVDLEPADFTDPAARALVHRLTELVRQEARDDWRPSLLDLVDEPWLEPPVARARGAAADIARLTDPQVTAEAQRITRQLRMSRLVVEINETTQLLDDAEPTELAAIVAAIAEKNRQRKALWTTDPSDVATGGVARRVALVPARFRLPIEPPHS